MRLSILLVTTLALAVPLLAGCVSKGDDLAAEPGAGLSQASLESATVAPRPLRTLLPLNVTTSAVWVNPRDTVQLTATAPSATSVSWYLSPRAPLAPASTGGASCVHLMPCFDSLDGQDERAACASALGPGPCAPAANPPPATPKLDTGYINSGESKSIKLTTPGVYQLHCHPHPWMRANITVLAGAPNGDAVISITDGATNPEYRFGPEDTTVGPGSTVTFHNVGNQTHTATMHTFLIPIKPTGKSASYVADTTGDFDVVAIARDGASGVAQSGTRLFVDPARPSDTLPLGPYKGTFNAGAPIPNNQQQESKLFSFAINFPAKSLTIKVTSTSQTPIPTMVSATLTRSGESSPIATMASAADGTITASKLPEGTYTLTIFADQGVMIDYAAEGSAQLDLSPPSNSVSTGLGGHA